MKATTQDPTLERVLAAVDHARVSIFREESEEQVHQDLEQLGHMGTSDAPVEDSFATAIELLATLPPDTLHEIVEQFKTRR